MPQGPFRQIRTHLFVLRYAWLFKETIETNLFMVLSYPKRQTEKSRKSHKQKPQPTPDTRRKRKSDTD